MTSLTNEFTIDEVLQIISALPNNKAAGITGITYEDIKHLHPDLKEYIKHFFNLILQSQIYPQEYHNLINENNRAGLIGQSTLQPPQTIQHIIESAHKDKKPLWIGLQDLRKANRKNNVILPSGLSSDYDVLQGIDQGEVISPILWIIYYDPMFTHLSTLTDNLHTTSITKINNIYQPSTDLKINYSSSVVGYLDDTRGCNPIVYYYKSHDLLPDLTSLDLQSLWKHIMFMNQLTSIDGAHLATWKEIKQQNPKANFQGPKPRWFQELEKSNVTLSEHSRHLSRDLNLFPPARYIFMSPLIRKESIFRPKNEWTISWDLAQQCEFYGKMIEQQNDIYVSLTSSLILFKTHSKQFKFHNNIYTSTKNLIFPIKPLHTLRLLLAFTITKHRLIVPNVLPTHIPILSSLDSYLDANSDNFINSTNLNLNISSPFFIINIFLGSRDTIIQLFEISKLFSSYKNFIFYTNSSFSKIDENSSILTQMGFAWIETSTSTPNSGIPHLHFLECFSLIYLQRKLKYTLYLPPLSWFPIIVHWISILIHLNMIHTFYKITNKLTSIRQKLKCNNHIAWRLIDVLIEKKHLNVHLHKVKAHSNNYWNNLADDLANIARSLTPIEVNPTHLLGSLMTPLWASIAPVDRDIRKFCHNITDLYTFDNLLGNSALAPIFDRFPITSIHWPLTQRWLHHNSTLDICSSTKSSYDAFKIKSFNHILPCGDVLTKYYPDLYSSTGIPCLFCTIQQDTNKHLGLCTNLFPIINKIIYDHKAILQQLILDNDSSQSSILIAQALTCFDLLLPISHDNSLYHPIYLVIHQLIPQDLYDLIRSFTFNDKLTRKIIWDFLLSFHEHIYQQIWPSHCFLLRAWE
ncbi:hypothetical protein RhiirC2_779064 [Rhizophagus irregularis]|uniref:Reverse transcriptase domain-containing protein n=1 Tax=Rhizophagus irregularis TaxID=588596 RepID=A0A2N1NAG4_9GLOM|nr:hypothetical protein RhiirC2_779064 [Rhizophagus irregularis]